MAKTEPLKPRETPYTDKFAGSCVTYANIIHKKRENPEYTPSFAESEFVMALDNMRNLENALAAANAWIDGMPAAGPAPVEGEVCGLLRYGFPTADTVRPVLCEDGYWTPWHIAAAAVAEHRSASPVPARPEAGLPPHCPTVAYIHPKPEGRYGHAFGLHEHQDGTGDLGSIPSCESEGCIRVEIRSPAAGAWQPMETAAVRDVLAERRRQVEKEGWTPEHDDEHAQGEMALAAACYAHNAALPRKWDGNHRPRFWPWETKWWNPKDPRRDMIRAAALLLAEIERLDRAQPPATTREA